MQNVQLLKPHYCPTPFHLILKIFPENTYHIWYGQFFPKQNICYVFSLLEHKLHEDRKYIYMYHYFLGAQNNTWDMNGDQIIC